MSTDNKTLQQRREKAAELADLGVKLYDNTFHPAHSVAQVLPMGESLVAEQHDESTTEYSVAGRVMAMRKFGKAAFFQVMDKTGRVQIYIKKDVIGEEIFAQFKKWDIGDIVGIKGHLFKTKVGELSIAASSVQMISKSLRPLPDKWHGLSDVETRYRQRYVDLIVTPESREVFRKRGEIIRHIRDFLSDRGFMEVETPMMQAVPGGATAKPFKTHHNALDMDLYLRVAPELYLKRLLVGGLERVFEINRNFRNEGLSTRHNPEFTMLEFYQAYATYEDMMDITEEMVSTACEKVNGSMQIQYQGTDVNLAPPWQRMTMQESLTKVAGIAPEIMADAEATIALAKEKGIRLEETAGHGKAMTELFELLVEEKLIDPTFITSYPTEVSPLARRNDEDPSTTDRFELFITGRELANAFSELNDPVDQYQRFAKQIAERGDDEEIHPELDHDYIRALEYGMPSAAGEGIGIDRLTMLLTDSPSIRDVIFFPHLKAETKKQDKEVEKK
ncbi:lysine--tRNA ligase [Desulfotalea psychrophila]|uniref:Lysine--tRNA ligase n=1 Tax=Desulfotalea psychrophila (strain LSv54 / DSM 12343) TaxID=177439 RepID=Q6AMR7_DESPS|nr:lysine--tRNA ligase [Desulfotalea psychrophila]CAG36358.1 probable lysyl-tRNA synthetase [Desulfotalea psychrophila LSv54]